MDVEMLSEVGWSVCDNLMVFEELYLFDSFDEDMDYWSKGEDFLRFCKVGFGDNSFWEIYMVILEFKFRWFFDDFSGWICKFEKVDDMVYICLYVNGLLNLFYKYDMIWDKVYFICLC